MRYVRWKYFRPRLLDGALLQLSKRVWLPLQHLSWGALDDCVLVQQLPQVCVVQFRSISQAKPPRPPPLSLSSTWPAPRLNATAPSSSCAGRTGLLSGYGSRRELCVGQPSDDDVFDEDRICEAVREDRAGTGHARRLRRVAQYRKGRPAVILISRSESDAFRALV